MPPKARISREMILEAAFKILQTEGMEKVNVRAIGEALQCSTQPVLYHFRSIEEIKQALYERADQYHSAYLFSASSEEPMMEIGLNYIRFAAQEKNLFRLLFQSGSFGDRSFGDLLDGEALNPILELFQRETGLTMDQTKRLFKILFLAVHGYASMFAGNGLVFEETAIAQDLRLLYTGCLREIREER